MKNANNLQEVWCSVDYSLILQAKFAERAKRHVKRLVSTLKNRKDNSLPFFLPCRLSIPGWQAEQ